MGCSNTFACSTCRKSYYLGYGSYSTWLTPDTLAEYDRTIEEWDRKLGELAKNKRVRECLVEHDGHDHFYFNEDFAHRHGRVLCAEVGYMGGECLVLAYDFGVWEHVDLEERDEKAG
jgi:hypothetical protein